jgi:hypothetical protein
MACAERRTVAIYTIRVLGQIDAQWSEWFGGLTIAHPHAGEAVISGDIVDQAALHGTLNRIRNLNLALISVTKVDPEPVDPIRHTGQ